MVDFKEGDGNERCRLVIEINVPSEGSLNLEDIDGIDKAVLEEPSLAPDYHETRRESVDSTSTKGTASVFYSTKRRVPSETVEKDLKRRVENNTRFVFPKVFLSATRT